MGRLEVSKYDRVQQSSGVKHLKMSIIIFLWFLVVLMRGWRTCQRVFSSCTTGLLLPHLLLHTADQQAALLPFYWFEKRKKSVALNTLVLLNNSMPKRYDILLLLCSKVFSWVFMFLDLTCFCNLIIFDTRMF